ncbi:hypothetical protein [Pseudomonas migulae]|uniref:Ferritin-like domain-containing protein n=1 Tax=Pseudomonas migulae TaxID=78543 RepID=A0A1H5MCB4_9PSED|nr:hypothetical protein [Pseudomonas migulae]SEE87012.1 hypothetical protein SAMN04490194_4639 [Pseudomonas migulae]
MNAHIESLLSAERNRSSMWWQILSKMRAQDQMPEWASLQGIGTGRDHGRYLAAQDEVNRFLSDGNPESPDEQAALIDLLEAERTHAQCWWSMLNTMRARKQLPDWVRIHHIGTGPEYDRYSVERTAVNRALFGMDWVRSLADLDQVEIERREFRRQFATNVIPMFQHA